jgi:hypothetical protein
MQKNKDTQILELYKEYLGLRNFMSHDEALGQMDYLHPVSLARLKKYINANLINTESELGFRPSKVN